MPKNIVIYGTGNEFGAQNSNVVKVYKMIVCDQSQVPYYHRVSAQRVPATHSARSANGGRK